MDRLLERDEVLAELGRCRRVAARGSGRMVWLRGEAGVGKTAVIAWFLAGLGHPHTAGAGVVRRAGHAAAVRARCSYARRPCRGAGGSSAGGDRRR